MIIYITKYFLNTFIAPDRQDRSDADSDLREAAASNNEGYCSYILKPVVGLRGDTENEAKNVIEHIEQGCCSSPIPPAALYPDELMQMEGLAGGRTGGWGRSGRLRLDNWVRRSY